MAETTLPDTLRGYTLTISDGTTPTALTYSVRLTEGSMTHTNGGRTIVRAKDTNGDFLGAARDGGQAGVSTISITAWMFGTGGDGTDISLTDIVHNEGLFASTWVATSSVDANIKDVDIQLTRADLTGSKGADYDWTNCIIQPGSSVNWSRDGNKLTLTFETPDDNAAITQNP